MYAIVVVTGNNSIVYAIQINNTPRYYLVLCLLFHVLFVIPRLVSPRLLPVKWQSSILNTTDTDRILKIRKKLLAFGSPFYFFLKS